MEKAHAEKIAELMEKHGKLMAQLVARRISDAELAQDLVQEVFLTACCKPVQVYAHEKPVAWLYDTLNKLTMREMDKAYHGELPLLNLDWAGAKNIDLPMEHFLPDGLTAKERELILERVDSDTPFEKMAERRGIREDACRQQVSRALRKCRALIDQELAGRGVGV